MQLSLSWTKPSDDDYSHSEVYEHTSDASGSATKIGTASGAFTRSGLGSAVTRYYWVKAVDYSGNTSGFSSVASGTTDKVGSTDIDTAGVQNVNIQNSSVTTLKIGSAATMVPVGFVVSADTANTTTTSLATIMTVNVDFGTTDTDLLPTNVFILAGMNFLRTSTNNTSTSARIVLQSANSSGTAVTGAGSDMGTSVTAGFSTTIESGHLFAQPTTQVMTYRVLWQSTAAGQFSQGDGHMLILASKR
jgi:hypothetical protein